MLTTVRRVVVAGAGVLALIAGGTGCTEQTTRQTTPTGAEVPADQSWAPRPTTANGLVTLATSGTEGFALRTERGPVGFLPGMNLGSTVPSRQPGELAIESADYRRWFDQMGTMGVRAVRIYTIHPPAFYDELARYNEAHPAAPLYLVQGVYLPDETYVETGDLFAGGPTAAFTQELRDASAAVHGDLERSPRRGFASGAWSTDVSPWLVSWIIGVEWSPEAIHRSDRRHATAAQHNGRYFRSTGAASPTEHWLAARMDELATAEADRGHSAPIAFVNWPTTDPLEHPDEPLPAEDLVGVDANQVRATDDWPGGTFASYHAYPYYPDFQRYETALTETSHAGRPDPYAGYLAALRRHHAQAGLPVLVTEYGVPSSIGSAHAGPLGRDQGGHSEAEAMRIDAELMHLIHDQGLAGAFVFSWTDEWFKRTWNTMEHQLPAERRQLWHDPLTNEQYFGVVATDALGPADQEPATIFESEGALRSVSARTDEAYLRLSLQLAEMPEGTVSVAIDTLPGGEYPPTGDRAAGAEPEADYVFELDPADGSGQAWVRTDLDPTRLDGAGPAPAGPRGWNPQRLVTNRSFTVEGEVFPVEYAEVGRLRSGVIDETADDYDSLAVWQLHDDVIDVRIPWAMAGLADPSSKQALAPGPAPDTVEIEGVGVSVAMANEIFSTEGVTWEPWQSVRYSERLKPGTELLADAFRELSRD